MDNDVHFTRFFVEDGSQNRAFEYTANGTSIENDGLNSGIAAPRGATTIKSNIIWVVDNNRRLYVYDKSDTLLGQWSAGSMASNAQTEGIATNGSEIWIVENHPWTSPFPMNSLEKMKSRYETLLEAN